MNTYETSRVKLSKHVGQTVEFLAVYQNYSISWNHDYKGQIAFKAIWVCGERYVHMYTKYNARFSNYDANKLQPGIKYRFKGKVVRYQKANGTYNYAVADTQLIVQT